MCTNLFSSEPVTAETLKKGVIVIALVVEKREYNYRQAMSIIVTNLIFFFYFVLVEAPVSKSGPGYSGAPRIQRQEQVIHLSPKKGSQVGLHFRLRPVILCIPLKVF